MKMRWLSLFVATVATGMIVGCSSQPSVHIAPDVKEPDNRNVSGEEILRRKQAADAQNPR